VIFDKIKSVKDYAQYWPQIEASISRRDKPFKDDSPKAMGARKKSADNSIWKMAELYFPDYVRDEAAGFHSRWEAISRTWDEPVLVEAFRGAGKSTFFTFLDPIHTILFGRVHYMLFCSYNEDKSTNFTGRILAELKYNRRIAADFGQIIGKSIDYKAIGHFEAQVPKSAIKTTVQAVSIGQDPRGWVAGSRRPDYARLDDIQSRKLARNRKNVENTLQWITLDLIPAMASRYNLVISATAVNNRDAVTELKKGSTTRAPVHAHRFPALIAKDVPLWPAVFPLSRLNKLRETIGSKEFSQEYLLNPIGNNDGVQESWLVDYNPAEITGKEYQLILSFTDLGSRKTTEKHDYKATICIGVNPGPEIDILAARIRRETPRQLIVGMYLIYNTFAPSAMYWEDNGQQDLMLDVWEAEAEKYGYQLPLRPVHNTVNKQLRIEQTLFPLLENHKIRFHPHDPDQRLLKEQLLDLFDGPHDDGPDSLSCAVRQAIDRLRRRRQGPPKSTIRRESYTLLRRY